MERDQAFGKCVRFICKASVRQPFIWLFILLLILLPVIFGIRHIELDTNLIHLLPDHSTASVWTRKLEKIIGDGGYFTLLLEGSKKEALVSAVKDAAKKLRSLDDVFSVSFNYPVSFINRYKYLLIKQDYLDELLGKTISLKAKHNPFADDLLTENESSPPREQPNNNGENIQQVLSRLARVTEYHQSTDGKLMGIYIRPSSQITNLDNMRRLYRRLKSVAAEIAQKHHVNCQVGGSQNKNLREYDSVVSELGRAGIISGTALLIILTITFRSLKVTPILLGPLAIGLLVSFALVPVVVGPLNIVTVFLLLILVGLGIDYTIHLLKRFQLELMSNDVLRALNNTFTSTGRSVIISALTTAMPMLVLSFSNFRGFSTFGIILGGSILIIVLVIFVVMPAALVLGHHLGVVRAKRYRGWWLKPLLERTTIIMFVIVIAGCLYGVIRGTGFDYSFIAYSDNNATIKAFKKKHKSVYPESMSPAALYLVPTLTELDQLLERLRNNMSRENSRIDRFTSIRDFVPSHKDYQNRLLLVKDIKKTIAGRWTRRIKDEQLSKHIEDLKRWEIPDHPPEVENVPIDIISLFTAHEGSGRYIAGIYSKGSRREGREAIAFTKELYALKLPEGTQGPIGETPVFAEILRLVLQEGPWMVSLALCAVAITILINSRSFIDTGWILFPLITGIGLTFAMMAWFNIQMNHYNVIVIPALLGMGVDDGVHYYLRVKELDGNVHKVQKELWSPLSVCTLTTITGYFGLIMSSHTGLRSIGIMAIIGMISMWITSLILLPGLLRWKVVGSAVKKEESILKTQNHQ